MSTESTSITAVQATERLRVLLAERALAEVEGLTGNVTYMADLDGEIAATRTAYVGMAVTEIAVLRGQLSGRPQG